MTTRYIPEEIKKAVRRNSYFGCVLCGLPIYHYEHIEEFHIVKEHTVDNITLLCPNHHQDKTSGRITKETILYGQKNPKNKQQYNCSPYNFFINGYDTKIIVGSNTYISNFYNSNKFVAIQILDKVMLGVEKEDNCLLINFTLTDKQGSTILEIKQSELIFKIENIIDYKYEGKKLSISHSKENNMIEIEFLEKGLNIKEGLFFYRNVLLEIRNTYHGVRLAPDFNELIMKMSGNVMANNGGTGLMIA